MHDLCRALRRHGRGLPAPVDPPCWGCEGDYGPIFTRGDFARMADLLAALKGRFLLSLNDRPEVREVFGRFRMVEVETTYSIGTGTEKARRRELLIGNWGW